VEFGHDFNGIVCNRSDLESANPNADPAMARYVGRLLDEHAGAGVRETAGQVRELIVSLLGSGRCTIDLVAQHLGIDRRTVHRRLADEGATYTDLLDSVRRELAVRYMASRERTLTQVSTLLGFSAPSGFSRWYRRQFNSPASEKRFRKPRRAA
jgi:AraC-like DNA-binding protein